MTLTTALITNPGDLDDLGAVTLQLTKEVPP